MHGADRLIVQRVLECRYFEQRAAGWLIFIFCRINFQPCAWVQTQSGQVAGKPAVSRLYFRYYFPMGYFLMRLPSLNAAGARQRRGEKPTSSAVSPIHRRGGGKGYMAQLPEDAKNHFCAESIDALKNLQREGLMPHVPAKKKRPDEKKTGP